MALLLIIPHPNSSKVGPSLMLAVFNRDGRTCVYCGATTSRLNVDHVTPCAHFPSDAPTATVNDPQNLVTSCEACNGAKGPQDLDGFARMLRGRGVLTKDVSAMRARVRAAVRRVI